MNAESRAHRLVKRSERVVRFVAMPTFAAMGSVAAIKGDGMQGVLCAAGSAPHLNDMATMYALMALFHLGPWIEALSRWTCRPRPRTARPRPVP